MYELIWTLGAQRDLQNLYNERLEWDSDRADELDEEVDKQLRLLRNNPQMASVYRVPVRRLKVKRFQVGVYYTVEGRRIILHVVASLYEPPHVIARRLDEILGDDEF